MTAADIQSTILAVWRIEQPRLITSLSRMLRDVPLAEDLTQEALVAALEHWPADGVPEKPGAWLMATAKRRALDHIRRNSMLTGKHGMLAHDLAWEQETTVAAPGGTAKPAAVKPAPAAAPPAGAADGDVSLVMMLDLETEVEMKLPGRYKVSPQIAGAIKAVAGVVDVQTL